MAIRVKFGWLEPLGRLRSLGIIRLQTPNYAFCIMHYALTQLGRVPMASPPRAAFQATPASASPRATSWVPHSSFLIHYAFDKA